jgi:hypothetical protein
MNGFNHTLHPQSSTNHHQMLAQQQHLADAVRQQQNLATQHLAEVQRQQNIVMLQTGTPRQRIFAFLDLLLGG